MKLSKKSPDSQQYTATIKCPYCEERTTIFHKLSASEHGSWNEFNFKRHLASVHKATAKIYENIDEKSIEEKFDQDVNENRDENLAVGSVVNMKDVDAVPFTSSNIISIVSYSDHSDSEENDDDDGNEFLFVNVPGQVYQVITEKEGMNATKGNGYFY